jgi:hypothetical protein
MPIMEVHIAEFMTKVNLVRHPTPAGRGREVLMTCSVNERDDLFGQ